MAWNFICRIDWTGINRDLPTFVFQELALKVYATILGRYILLYILSPINVGHVYIGKGLTPRTQATDQRAHALRTLTLPLLPSTTHSSSTRGKAHSCWEVDWWSRVGFVQAAILLTVHECNISACPEDAVLQESSWSLVLTIFLPPSSSM